MRPGGPCRHLSRLRVSLPYSLLLELALLGLCTGFLAGLLGIGGGMVMVPFITIILSARDYPPQHVIKIAVATSLATICFTSLSSVRAHHRHGAVLWRVVRYLAPGIVLGSLLGSQIAAAMPARVLGLIFAGFVAFSATQMFFNRKPQPQRTLPGASGLFGVGALIGAISSLVGAGGAFISVPFMTWCNVRIHNAVATSAALGFPIALAGTIGYALAGWRLPDMPPGTLGYVYWPAFLLLSAASMLTAPFGARVAHRMEVAPLRRVFAGVLYVMAGYFILR